MLVNLLAVVFVLGVMIIFHELGHFLAAKYFNVRVEAFSIGFGKRLIGRVHDGTDYRICALPLGGYVKMAGDNIGEGTGDPGEFLSKPRWQRFFIAVMGPVFNLILAVALLTGLYMYRYERAAFEEGPAKMGYIQENSPAAKAGVQAGDIVTKIDGVANPNWETVALRALSNPGQSLELGFRKPDGKEVSSTITPDPKGPSRAGFAGWWPVIPALVGNVDAGEAADKAGIKPGDRILAVNGKEILFRPQMVEVVQQSKGAPLTLKVRRGSQDFETSVVARDRETEGVGKMWRIGITFQDEVIAKRLSLGDAFMASVERNRTFAMLIFDFLGKLLERRMSPRSLEGPIGISRLAGEAARQGPVELVTLMSMISINLAIFNLLPIPILDGGVILLLLIEGTMRRDLSISVKEKIITAGFVFLVLFAAYVTYMDIVKSLPTRFERFLP